MCLYWLILLFVLFVISLYQSIKTRNYLWLAATLIAFTLLVLFAWWCASYALSEAPATMQSFNSRLGTDCLKRLLAV